MSRLRIVTFNAHQPYLHLLSRIPIDMDVIQLKNHGRFLQTWSETVRPLPDRWELIDREEAERRIRKGRYALALAHNINDYIDFNRFSIPKVLLIHVSITGRILEEKSGINRESYLADVRKLLQATGGRLVYISEFKKSDWGIPGRVIPHGIDPSEYPDYTGSISRILRVANNLVERDAILDYRAHRRLTEDFPLTLIGDNPMLPQARRSKSWEDLKMLYASHRLYLHTAVPACEDGYNLAMLEAMAAGMPIVSTAHPTSPLSDGHNGFISSDLAILREKIAILLSNQDLAATLGRKARETVAKKFSLQTFAERWGALFAEMGL